MNLLGNAATFVVHNTKSCGCSCHILTGAEKEKKHHPIKKAKQILSYIPREKSCHEPQPSTIQ